MRIRTLPRSFRPHSYSSVPEGEPVKSDDPVLVPFQFPQAKVARTWRSLLWIVNNKVDTITWRGT